VAPAEGRIAGDTTIGACDGRMVAAVAIDPRRPRFRGPLALWRRAARSVGLHNTSTREQVIRRFLSLESGRPCTEFRRAESERLLRAQPFLASATVRVLPVGPDSVRVEVETVDEAPAVVAARYGPAGWGLGLGNDNAFGTGMLLEGRVSRREGYRDGFGATFEHRQILGRPYVLRLDARRNAWGHRGGAELAHAFLTDLQRVAWHAG